MGTVSGEDNEAVIDAAYETAKVTRRPAANPNDPTVRFVWEPYGFDPNRTISVSDNLMPPKTDKAIFRLFYIGQLKPRKGKMLTEVMNNLVCASLLEEWVPNNG